MENNRKLILKFSNCMMIQQKNVGFFILFWSKCVLSNLIALDLIRISRGNEKRISKKNQQNERHRLNGSADWRSQTIQPTTKKTASIENTNRTIDTHICFPFKPVEILQFIFWYVCYSSSSYSCILFTHKAHSHSHTVAPFCLRIASQWIKPDGN